MTKEIYFFVENEANLQFRFDMSHLPEGIRPDIIVILSGEIKDFIETKLSLKEGETMDKIGFNKTVSEEEI